MSQRAGGQETEAGKEAKKAEFLFLVEGSSGYEARLVEQTKEKDKGEGEGEGGDNHVDKGQGEGGDFEIVVGTSSSSSSSSSGAASGAASGGLKRSISDIAVDVDVDDLRSTGVEIESSKRSKGDVEVIEL